MRIVVWDELGTAEQRAFFDKADDAAAGGVETAVRAIMADVRANGDDALRRLTQRFDRYDPSPVMVGRDEMAAAGAALSPETRCAMETAYKTLRAFHEAQGYRSYAVETVAGVTCARKVVPIGRVGLYWPAGSAPLLSTALMLGVPAQLAGNPVRVACAPADASGRVNAGILYAAQLCGITQVARIGGVQAIAAMAFGTASVPAVDKIFGPGNMYVAQAKMQALSAAGVAVDLPAGPSEAMVVVDAATPACLAAADLLAQAEHDPVARVFLVAPSRGKVEAVLAEVKRQLADLPRAGIARAALGNGASAALVVSSQAQAVEVANLCACEHLILAFEDYDAVLAGIVAAGSVFCGLLTPESFGDYASGTNHVLPTARAARAYSGLTVEAFQKTMTVQSASRAGFEALAETVVALARAEGLEAHARAVLVRREG